MSRRTDRINKHILRTFGEIIQTKATVPVGTMVTISRVDTTPNLKSSTVWLYISPPGKEDEVLETLTSQMYDLQGEFNRAVDMRPLPRIRLKVDTGLDNAIQVQRLLQDIHEED